MKLLLVSDIHARDVTEVSQAKACGISTSMADTLALFARIKAEAAHQKIDAIVIAGDLLHDRQTVSAEVLVHLVRAVHDLPCMTLLVLGNHDLADNDQRLSILEVFAHIHGVTVVSKPCDFQGANGLMLRAVPYDRDEALMAKQMAASDWAFADKKANLLSDVVPCAGTGKPQRRVCITHAMFRGAARGPWDYFGDTSGVPVAAVAGFDATFSGHVHRRQVLAGAGVPVWDLFSNLTLLGGSVVYLGSPYPMNAAQIGEDLGFWTYDTEANTARFCAFDGPVYREVSSAAEVEALLEEVDPTQLHLRVTLSDPSEADRVRALAATCRTVAVRVLPTDRPDPERVAVARAVGDEDLLRKYLAARGHADLPSLDAALEDGLVFLRGGDANVRQ